MDRRPIGIFDSGVGGLTALRSLRALLPCEDLIFLADTARVPYGVRSAGELNAIAEDNFLLLESLGVKAVLAACGTVSANCAALIDGWPTPACGVLEPSVRAAAAAARGRAGVLATEATVRSGAFERLFASIAPELELLSRGAAHATFVDLDRRAAQRVRRTAGALGAGRGEVDVLAGDACALAGRGLPGAPFDIVFLDPPYALPAERVSAHGQNAALESILPRLTEEEAEIYRRGRNAKKPTKSKNATVGEYVRSTGFEALIGFLYLTGRAARIEELFFQEELS